MEIPRGVVESTTTNVAMTMTTETVTDNRSSTLGVAVSSPSVCAKVLIVSTPVVTAVRGKVLFSTTDMDVFDNNDLFSTPKGSGFDVDGSTPRSQKSTEYYSGASKNTSNTNCNVVEKPNAPKNLAFFWMSTTNNSNSKSPKLDTKTARAIINKHRVPTSPSEISDVTSAAANPRSPACRGWKGMGQQHKWAADEFATKASNAIIYAIDQTTDHAQESFSTSVFVAQNFKELIIFFLGCWFCVQVISHLLSTNFDTMSKVAEKHRYGQEVLAFFELILLVATLLAGLRWYETQSTRVKKKKANTAPRRAPGQGMHCCEPQY